MAIFSGNRDEARRDASEMRAHRPPAPKAYRKRTSQGPAGEDAHIRSMDHRASRWESTQYPQATIPHIASAPSAIVPVRSFGRVART